MKITLEIQNLKCGSCAQTISSKLLALQGVYAVTVNHENHTVTFNHENELALINAKKLLSKIGYPITTNKNSLTTKVKSFVSCALGSLNKK